MTNISIAKDEKKLKEMLIQLLRQEGYAVSAETGVRGDFIRVTSRESVDIDSLKEKVIKLEDALYSEKKGLVYKSILDTIEKPMIEHILERTEGNQLKAAGILGINRNTIRVKIKRLGIDPKVYRNK